MTFSDRIPKACALIESTDTILVGVGRGMSAAAGLSFARGSDAFRKHFGDFAEKYGIEDVYSGAFYPFATLEEYWAWWSRVVWLTRFMSDVTQPYRDLYEIVKNKDYFILTTNADGQFERAGFDMKRVFAVQGDYALLQCTIPCTSKTYADMDIMRDMYEQQRDMKIPTELIPICPSCGAPLTMNLRLNEKFVEDDGWNRAAEAYTRFLRHHRSSPKVLFDIGVGFHAPGIIKHAFWHMTDESPDAHYILLNPVDLRYPQEIASRTVAIREDAAAALAQMREIMDARK